MLPATVNLQVYHGDSWAQTFRFSNGDGPVDLTGSTLAAWARDSQDETTELVVAGAEDGTVTLQLPVDGLDPNLYSYDIEQTDAAEAVTTWVRGSLQIVRDVTNDTD